MTPSSGANGDNPIHARGDRLFGKTNRSRIVIVKKPSLVHHGYHAGRITDAGNHNTRAKTLAEREMRSHFVAPEVRGDIHRERPNRAAWIALLKTGKILRHRSELRLQFLDVSAMIARQGAYQSSLARLGSQRRAAA
jgi:hypothetical protein